MNSGLRCSPTSRTPSLTSLIPSVFITPGVLGGGERGQALSSREEWGRQPWAPSQHDPGFLNSG